MIVNNVSSVGIICSSSMCDRAMQVILHEIIRRQSCGLSHKIVMSFYIDKYGNTVNLKDQRGAKTS